MIDFYKVGNKITQYRKKANLTQDELANQLFVTRQALSKWETGISIPSIETILDLSQIFEVSFEEILCLHEEGITKIETHDLFKNHTRAFVVKQIVEGLIKVDIPEVFYQCSSNERMIILKAIKEKKIPCNLKALKVRLTVSEQKYLFNQVYIGGNYDY